MRTGVRVVKKLWLAIFAIAWLYLFGVIGGIDAAEAAGEAVDFLGSSIRLAAGLGVVIASGVAGKLFS